MAVDTFTRQCVSDTLDGLRDGLSHFSGPSRTAVIFAIAPGDPFYVCDPQNLLRGHEPKLKELFIDGTNWGTGKAVDRDKRKFSHMLPEKNLDLTGLVSWGGRSSSVFHQMWFTEHHPDMCAIGPTERWLEHAAWRFSHDIANERALYTGISGSFLREYARHSVRDYIVDRMNVELGWDSQLRVYQILDAVLGISRTREERVMPDGKLIFAEQKHLENIDFLARFPELEQPLLDNFKHVRKMLQAAEEVHMDVDRLSFTGCFRILQCRLPECDGRSAASLDEWYRALLSELREETIGPRRNRINPRVIKRKMSRWKRARPEHRKLPPLTKTFEESVVMRN